MAGCPAPWAATRAPVGRLRGADLPSPAMAPPFGRPAAAKRRAVSSSASGSTADSMRWTQDFDGGTSFPLAGLIPSWNCMHR